MESAKSKLKIVFSVGFLATFCKMLEEIRNKDDEDLTKYLNFRKLLLDFSKNLNLFVLEGQPTSDEMFNRAFTELLENQKLRNLAINKIDNDEIKLPSYDSIFLLNSSTEYLNNIRNKYGLLASNADTINSDYNVATFDWKFNQILQIKSTRDNNKIFDHQQELSKYKLPSNQFTLMDPYLFTWNEDVIKINLCGLISSLITETTSDEFENLNINIFTTFPKRPSPKITQRFKDSQSRLFKTKSIHSILENEINIFGHFKISVFCIDLFELNKDNANPNENKKSTNLEIERLYKFCEAEIHDRWFYTNYYYCTSGRGFELIGIDHSGKKESKYSTTLHLFSQLQAEHHEGRKELETKITTLKQFSEQESLKKYFYTI